MGEAILEKHHSETSVPPSSKTLCLQNHPKTPSKWTSYEREVPPPSPPKKKTVKPPPSCFKRKGSWSLPGNVSLSIPSGVRNKSGSFQSRLILKELYNQGASRIRISATGIPASATLFHYAVCNVDVVCVSETWAIPHWIFGYCDSKLGSIRMLERTRVKQLSFSLFLDRVRNRERRKGEERKEKKKKGGKRKQRNVTNFRSSRGKLSRRGTFAQEST